MFWNWFRKPKQITRDEARAEGEAIMAFLRPHWARYAASLPPNDAVILSNRMKMFVAQMRVPVGKAFPEYKGAPDKIFLSMVVILALEGNTHSVDAVESATVDIEAADIEVDLKTEAIRITAALREKWIHYLGLLPFREGTPLAKKVEHFLPMANEYVTTNYPVMKVAPPGLIWEMVWVAVIDSKTHPLAEVNTARAALGAKIGLV